MKTFVVLLLGLVLPWFIASCVTHPTPESQQPWESVTRRHLLRDLKLDAHLPGGEISPQGHSFRDGGSFGFQIRIPNDQVIFVTAIHSSAYIGKNGQRLYRKILIGPYCSFELGIDVSRDKELVPLLLKAIHRHKPALRNADMLPDIDTIIASLED